MTSKFSPKRNLLCIAISLSMLPVASSTLAQDEGIEEVVVTGTYIRRSEGFTQASSVLQLSAEDLEAEGTMNLGEVIQNLSFVGGEASAITNTFQASGTDERSTNIDLRGLGASSTLTLLDGKRLANQNVNALIPSIALQRLDIVADGAAALYGNEAVAGVVNFVPYKSYDGLKIDIHSEGDSRGDYDEHSAQFLWGGVVADIDLVFAGQFRQTARLAWDERPELANSSLSFSSQANPGTYWVPERDENGLYLGDPEVVSGSRTRLADLGCGLERDRLNDSNIASPRGFFDRRADGSINPGLCRYEFGDNHSLRNPLSSNHFFGNATWEYNEDLTLSMQGFFTRISQTNYGSTSNPGNARASELPTVRGEHPGNPFRATNALGQPLFGIDSNGDGLPDRGSADLNNDGLMDYILSGNGGLAPGIPLMEDVTIASLRLLAKHNTLSDAHNATGDNPSGLQEENSRITLQADFTVPYLSGWEGLAAFSHNVREIDFLSNQNFDITDVIQGLNCDVINDLDACYSPFVSDTFRMSPTVVNAVAAREREQERDELQTFDLVINGNIPLWGGGGLNYPAAP